MATPLNIRHNLYRAPTLIADPGASATITIDKDGGVCPVTTAAAEARTLRVPTKAGIVGTIVLYEDGGDLTLTVTNGYNADADTSITFADAGDFVTFISINVGGTYYWRIIAQEGTNVAGETLTVDTLAADTLTVGGYAIAPGTMTPGAGISPVTDSVYKASVVKIGDIYKTTIYIGLKGLSSGGTANDIIGKNSTAGCHLGRITAAVNGTIFAGQITCLETPTGGDPDIDLYSSTAADGTEDAAATSLAGQAILANCGDHSGGSQDSLTAVPAANSYLYLACGDVTDATYTAGKLLIELWGA